MIRNLSIPILSLVMGLWPIYFVQAENRVTHVGDHQWEKIGFDGVPIKMSLKSGELSVLRFPWRVSLAVPDHLEGAIDLTAMGDQVLFTPLMDFETARFWAESTTDGSMFIVDIASSESADTVYVDFVDARGVVDGQGDYAMASSDPVTQTMQDTQVPEAQDVRNGAQMRDAPVSEQSSEHSFAALSRYALQSIYSPRRFDVPMAGITKRNIEQGKYINDLVPGYRTLAKAEKEWVTASGLYVTALSVKNGENTVLNLDPRRLRHEGSWLSSAYWSTKLNPRGNLGDSTTVVVISRTSWSDIGVDK
ncbi:DUF3438 family protein [bacterium]|nr:DUF3438 family protein [bacterium]